MKLHFVTGFVCSCVLITASSFHSAYAQATASGAITGVVTDPSGAVITGATVTLTSLATAQTRTAVTNASGTFSFEQLALGAYKERIESQGFSVTEIPSLELLIGSSVNQTVHLTAGGSSVTVEVSSDTSLMDTDKTDISASITPQQVQDLPLNGRDIGTLAILAPGVRPVNSYDATKTRYATFGVNGSSGRDANATVNGIDNKDDTVGGTVMQLPLEAVQEFIISANRFSAANGRSEGSVLNVVTKSGTNNVHASLFGFFRNDALNTIDKLDQQGGNSKPGYSRQQYGGSIGGPVLRDKDFLFFAYERLRERSNLTVSPTAFAQLSLLTAFGAKPATSIPTPFDDTRYNGRMDHVLNEKQHVSFTYTAQDNKAQNDQSGQSNDLTAGNYTTNDLILSSLSLTSILSDHLVNTAASGYQYWNNVIGTANPTATFEFTNGIYFGTNINVPQASYQGKWQFKDDLSWSKGKHTIGFGVDDVWMPKLGGFFTSIAPIYNFSQLPSFYENDPKDYPQGIATPGAVNDISVTAGNGYASNPGVKMFGVYVQDDWKTMPRLNLSLGLRYDRDFRTYGETSQPHNRAEQELAAIGAPQAGIPNPDWYDFSPRIGFTYGLTRSSRLLVRGGYGLYFGQTFLNIPFSMLRNSAPTLATTIDVQGAQLVPGTTIPVKNYRVGIDPAPSAVASTKVAAGASDSVLDKSFRNPYSQQFNLGFQISTFEKAVFDVDYVNARSLHTSKNTNINPLNPATGVRVLASAFSNAGQVVLGRITDAQSVNTSNYNALNLSYRQSYSKRLTGLVNFTYSKALSYEGAADDFKNPATIPFDLHNRNDYGPTPSDTRFRFVVAGSISFPWRIEVAPILQAESARPYDATQGATSFLGYGAGQSAPHLVVPVGQQKNYTALAGLTLSQYQACIVAATCVPLHYDSLRGTPYVQLDARFSKELSLGEKRKLRLFYQAFNLTNRANW